MPAITATLNATADGARDATTARTPARNARRRYRDWQQKLWRFAVPLLFLAGGWLLLSGVRELDWTEIFLAVRRFEWTTVANACLFVVAGYAAFSSYDLLCRHYERHRISTHKVLAIGFICLAFSMNLGSLVGGWGMRYRLYSRFGLRTRQITRIICLALLTNWSGFVLLAGALFAFRPPALPADWPLHGAAIVVLGAFLLACSAAYLLLCAYGKGRKFRIRGVQLRRPTLRMAVLQLVLSGFNWLCMAAVLHYFLPPQVTFLHVTAVLCVSSIAGLIVRVPAGLGVLEAVFLTLLAGEAGSTAIIAALLAFRACYYLLPLLVALLVYGGLELQARRRAQLSSS